MMARTRFLEERIEKRAIFLMTGLLFVLIFVPFFYYNFLSPWVDFTKLAPYYLGSWTVIAVVFSIFAYIFKIRFEPFTRALIISYLILLFFAPPIYFDIHLYSCFDISKVTSIYLLTIVIAVCWIVRIVRTGECKIAFPPKIILYPTTAWLIITILSTWFSICPYMAFVGTYKRYEGLLVLFAYLVGFYVVINFVQKERLYWLLLSVLIIGALSSVYAVVQHFGKDPLRWEHFDPYRVISTFGNPVFVSAYFSMVIFICLGMFLSFAEGSEKLTSKGRKKGLSLSKFLVLLLYGATVLFVYISFYYTKTRATFVGLAVATFIFVLIFYGIRFATIYYTVFGGLYLLSFYIVYQYLHPSHIIALFLGGLSFGLLYFAHLIIGAIMDRTKSVEVRLLSSVLGITLIFFTVLYSLNPRTSIAPRFYGMVQKSQRSVEIKREEVVSKEKSKKSKADPLPETISEKSLIQKIRDKFAGSAGWRMWMWTTGCAMIPDFWLIGIGPDTLGLVFAEYLAKVYVKKMEGAIEMEDRLHNEIFDTVVSRGIPGLLIYFWLIVAFSIFCYRGYRKADKKRRLLILGIYTGWLAYLVQNQFSFGNTPIASLYWMLMAIATKEIGPLTTINIPMAKNTKTAPIIYLLTFTAAVLLTIFAIRPYIADLYYKNGTIFAARGEWERTFSEYKRAISLNRREVRYWEELNRAYINCAISKPNKREYIEEAMKGAEVLKDLTNNRSYTAYFTLGMAHFMLGNLKRAEENYKRAITLNPFIADIHINLGMVYSAQKRFSLAAKEFEQAFEIRPGYTSRLDHLVRIWLAQGEVDKACRFLERISRYCNRSGKIKVHNLLAWIYYHKKEEYEKSIKESKKVLALNQREINAHRNLALCYYRKGEFEKSKEHFEKVLETDPGDSQAQQMLRILKRR